MLLKRASVRAYGLLARRSASATATQVCFSRHLCTGRSGTDCDNAVPTLEEVVAATGSPADVASVAAAASAGSQPPPPPPREEAGTEQQATEVVDEPLVSADEQNKARLVLLMECLEQWTASERLAVESNASTDASAAEAPTPAGTNGDDPATNPTEQLKQCQKVMQNTAATILATRGVRAFKTLKQKRELVLVAPDALLRTVEHVLNELDAVVHLENAANNLPQEGASMLPSSIHAGQLELIVVTLCDAVHRELGVAAGTSRGVGGESAEADATTSPLKNLSIANLALLLKLLKIRTIAALTVGDVRDEVVASIASLLTLMLGQCTSRLRAVNTRPYVNEIAAGIDGTHSSAGSNFRYAAARRLSRLFPLNSVLPPQSRAPSSVKLSERETSPGQSLSNESGTQPGGTATDVPDLQSQLEESIATGNKKGNAVAKLEMQQDVAVVVAAGLIADITEMVGDAASSPIVVGLVDAFCKQLSLYFLSPSLRQRESTGLGDAEAPFDHRDDPLSENFRRTLQQKTRRDLAGKQFRLGKEGDGAGDPLNDYSVVVPNQEQRSVSYSKPTVRLRLATLSYKPALSLPPVLHVLSEARAIASTKKNWTSAFVRVFFVLLQHSSVSSGEDGKEAVRQIWGATLEVLHKAVNDATVKDFNAEETIMGLQVGSFLSKTAAGIVSSLQPAQLAELTSTSGREHGRNKHSAPLEKPATVEAARKSARGNIRQMLGRIFRPLLQQAEFLCCPYRPAIYGKDPQQLLADQVNAAQVLDIVKDESKAGIGACAFDYQLWEQCAKVLSFGGVKGLPDQQLDEENAAMLRAERSRWCATALVVLQDCIDPQHHGAHVARYMKQLEAVVSSHTF